jgi:hypothetical protein
MIFRVCEHYDDEQPIYDGYYDKECFICFELKSSQGFKTINLMEQNLYIHNCICNGPIHKECLQLWFSMNSSCPICRNKMIERNNATVFIFNYVPYGISIYFFIRRVTLRLLHIIMVIMFLYKIIEFYLIVIGTRYRNAYIFDDEHYISNIH